MNESISDPSAYTYCKPTAINSPTVGNLYAARNLRQQLWKQVRALRQAIKTEPLGGNRSGLRLKLLRAESNWKDVILLEQQCLRAIEQRANEMGLTTVRRLASKHPVIP